MKMKRVLSLILSLVMVLGVFWVPSFASETGKTYGYDNLNNSEGDLVVGFLGGSITVADGDSGYMGWHRYATRVTEWFQEKYPNKNVTQVNAGIGGTGSDFGMYRVMSDIGAYAPDVVFVEYAVNDAHMSRLYGETVRSNMESIVRVLQSLPKEPVIVFLYSMHDNSYANIGLNAIPNHEAVADYYGIESINFYEYMSDLVEKGEFVWDKTQENSLTNDNIHPNAAGHEQYGNYIISQLESRNILHKNTYRNARKFEYTRKNPHDFPFSRVTKTGNWTESYVGQSDNKNEALKSTATGDTLTLTFEGSEIGILAIDGNGSFVVDAGRENEISGTFTENAAAPRILATNLSAGEHTITITSIGAGTAEDPLLKVGRFVTSDGTEVNSPTTAANGDHVPGSVPDNLIQGNQNGNIIGMGNNGNAGFANYGDDATGNASIYSFTAKADITAGGSWGGNGFIFKSATADVPASGILYDGYSAKAGTYVFSARVRTLSGAPKMGVATSKNYSPTFDDTYGRAGYTPGTEWEEYKTTVTNTNDGFALTFGFIAATTGDSFLLDIGDGIYYAPEEAYDVKVEANGANNEVTAGGKAAFKAALLNQIEIPGTLNQDFTWSVADASGNAVDGLSVTAGASTDEATVSATSDVPFGTYYLKAVSTATSWQKTYEIEVVEGPADPYAKDHIPGEMPENRVVNFKQSFWTSNTMTDKKAGLEGTNWINGDDWGSAKITAMEDITSVSSYHGSAGISIKTITDASYPKIEMASADYAAGDHYVFMFAARNGNTDIHGVKLRVGVWNGTYSGTASDYIPVQEYEDGIVELPDSGEWVVVKTTLSERSTGVAPPSIRMGLPVGSVKGTAIELNARLPGIQKAYYAKEVPYSINLEGVNGTSVAAGESTGFRAKLLNQLGLTGYLDQSAFTFTVGDDKGSAVDGLTVTSDGNVVTVSAAEDLAEGTYYLRANYPIDGETTWTKTMAITVSGLIENTSDWVAGDKPDNLVTASNPFSATNDGNVLYQGQNLPQDVQDEMNAAGRYYNAFFTANDYENTGFFGVGGAIFNYLNSYKIKGETTYVFEARIKSTTGNQVVNLVHSRDWKESKLVYSNEYGAGGHTVGTDWEDFKVTLTTGTLGASDNAIVWGLKRSDAGAYLLMDFSEGLYIAEEAAHDIAVDGASTVAAGDITNLSAEVTNQIGLKGALSQGFDWVAVTSDRTAYVDGITFTKENGGADVTVNVADDVAPGDYLVVAQSAYGMNRQFPITVTEAVGYDVTELTIETTANGASLTAASVNANKKVMIILAAFRGDKLAASNKVSLTPAGGVATLAEAVVLTGLEAGDKVRAFVWDEALTPFSMKKAYKQPVVIQ